MLDASRHGLAVQLQLVLQQVGLVGEEESCSFDGVGVDISLFVTVHVIMLVDGLRRSQIAQSLRSVVVEIVVVVREQVDEFPARLTEHMTILQGYSQVLVGQMVERVVKARAAVDVRGDVASFPHLFTALVEDVRREVRLSCVRTVIVVLG